MLVESPIDPALARITFAKMVKQGSKGFNHYDVHQWILEECDDSDELPTVTSSNILVSQLYGVSAIGKAGGRLSNPLRYFIMESFMLGEVHERLLVFAFKAAEREMPFCLKCYEPLQAPCPSHCEQCFYDRVQLAITWCTANPFWHRTRKKPPKLYSSNDYWMD